MYLIKGFADASKWAVKDNNVVYVGQNRTFKEVLMNGTPIEYFIEGEVPECVIGTKSINVRFQKAPEDKPNIKGSPYEFIDRQHQIIGKGKWVNITKDKLTNYPWFNEDLEISTYVIRLNDSINIFIDKVSDNGNISTIDNTCRYYICKNVHKPSRLILIKEDIIEGEYIKVESYFIKCSQVAYECLGGRYYTSPIKYNFNEKGIYHGVLD
jgi:hypothetical protein